VSRIRERVIRSVRENAFAARGFSMRQVYPQKTDRFTGHSTAADS